MTVFNDHIPGPDIGNCNSTFGTQGQKSITIWGPASPIQIPHNNGTSGRLYFTFTQPQCYDGSAQPSTQTCNVTYKIHTNSSSTLNDVGPIHFKINGNDSPDNYRYHSKLAGHDLIETIDLAPMGLLNQVDANWIEFVNGDTQVDVTLEGLTVFREYQTCYLPCDLPPTKCNGGNACRPDLICKAEQPYPEQPDFAPRQDYPCNYESCGGLSWTDFGYDDHITTISPGQTVSWTWTNPQNPSNNYIGPKSCLFNLNNVTLSNNSQGSDVNFRIRVNGGVNGQWLDFFHSKLSRHQAHSVDLATHPAMQPVYHDSPGASNVLELQLDAGADVNLLLCDGCDNNPCPPCLGGRVNIYRIYQTGSVCPPPCYVGCEVSCQTGCQVQCYGCQLGEGCWPCYGYCQTCVLPCELCESGYQWPCEICESCYTSCNTGCEVSCQSGCEASCQNCQSGCEVSCQDCQSECEVSCQVNCQTCQGGCEPSCYGCQGGCESCEVGCQVSCQSGCEASCQNCQSGCEVSCQDCQSGCEVSCQTGCEVSCQTCNAACYPGCYDCQQCYGCYTSCYDCEGCYMYY